MYIQLYTYSSVRCIQLLRLSESPIEYSLRMACLTSISLAGNIPVQSVQELPGGVFKWGAYRTEPGIRNLETGWAILNEHWQNDRQVRIQTLRGGGSQNEPGDILTLSRGEGDSTYTGRVWRSDEQWTFQEDGTGIRVSVRPNHDVNNRQRRQLCEAKLWKAVRTEITKRKHVAKEAAKRRSTREEYPKKASELLHKGTNAEGKQLYTWGDSDRGDIEVMATPRALRPGNVSQYCIFSQASARETTPERALRKMIVKVARRDNRVVRSRNDSRETDGE